MNAVDTNILFYSHDPRDAAKQFQAEQLIRNLTDGVLLWQVACEYLSASRKLAPFGYRFEDACNDLHDLRIAWTEQPLTWSALDRAMHDARTLFLSTWDALIVAACVEAGVTRLYTEDFGGRQPIDGVEFVNPFVHASDH